MNENCHIKLHPTDLPLVSDLNRNAQHKKSDVLGGGVMCVGQLYQHVPSQNKEYHLFLCFYSCTEVHLLNISYILNYNLHTA